MNHRIAIGTLALAALAGCGYVGDPQPPALNVPQPVQDLRGVQRGEVVILSFTPTLRSTDNLILKDLKSIDLRGGPLPENGFQIDAWAAGARTIAVPEARDEYTTVTVPVKDWAGKEVAFALRSVGPTGRASWWSNVLTLRIVPPPPTPRDLEAKAEHGGVRLTWRGDPPPEGASWRIWRKEQDGAEPVPAGESAEMNWLDNSVRTGARYEYAVQLLVPANDKQAESAVSATASVLHEDKFPPAIPSGLQAVAGVNTIELVWDRGGEADLAAWQIWRAEGGAPAEKLGKPVDRPSYSDSKVEKGKSYRYAVSAIDRDGNESRPSAAAEAIAP